ncbi:MAG TPA: hypothetical protein VJ916_03600 [Anaerovoracaceae bacterium]|nr:hypothetical protein [Anaerovoracaceae bacterium]
MNSIEKDSLGFEYYKELPPDAKQVKTVWHFVTIDPKEWNYHRRNIGMKYLLYGELSKQYEVYEITQFTQDEDLILFAKQGRLFILSCTSNF